MSMYEKRYNVSCNTASHYVDTPEEVLAIIDEADPKYPPPWVAEGYAEVVDHFRQGVTEYRRRQTRKVSRTEIELLVQRRKVEKMLEEMRAS